MPLRYTLFSFYIFFFFPVACARHTILLCVGLCGTCSESGPNLDQSTAVSTRQLSHFSVSLLSYYHHSIISLLHIAHQHSHQIQYPPRMSSQNTPVDSNPLLTAHLRIGRPTPSISALLPFYTRGLGFTIISSFTKHAGFDGVMLGHPSLPYHLEFTQQEGHDPGRCPSKDNLLVFYLPEKKMWAAAVEKMAREGFDSVESWNPYWDEGGKGRTFEDVDGWRVVLWCGRWNV
jgi:hypothetical protein